MLFLCTRCCPAPTRSPQSQAELCQPCLPPPSCTGTPNPPLGPCNLPGEAARSFFPLYFDFPPALLALRLFPGEDAGTLRALRLLSVPQERFWLRPLSRLGRFQTRLLAPFLARGKKSGLEPCGSAPAAPRGGTGTPRALWGALGGCRCVGAQGVKSAPSAFWGC